MRDLIIVGAGGFGRETLYVAKAINEIKEQWNIRGFIDDNIHALDNMDCDYPILGKISDWNPSENESFAMGVASPLVKESLSNSLKFKGAKFETLIDPRVINYGHSKFGEGCVVFPGSLLGDCLTIGNFVHIAGSMIGQDSIIGDYSTTTGYVNIASAIIGKRVFIGSHAVILNHLNVGDGAFICAGSVVFSNVKEGRKMIGNPAKIFKY